MSSGYGQDIVVLSQELWGTILFYYRLRSRAQFGPIFEAAGLF